jgi:hypothetical protein
MLKLAVPVVLAELGWMSMTIVDTIMVGRIGPEAIGAIGIGSSAYYSFAIFGMGLLLGLDTLVSQSYGAGDRDDCHHSLVLFLDLAQRAGMKGIQEWLSFYFKGPMTAAGLYPEHDIFIQLMKLKNTLRWMQGEDLITHLGLEYYD